MLSLAAEHYPSRNIEEAVLARRREPVLWGDIIHRPDWLEEALVGHYVENGFVVIPDLLGKSLTAQLLQESHRLLDACKAENGLNVIREPGSQAVRSIFDLATASTVFNALMSNPKLLGFARYVLGDEVYLHQSRLNHKPGFDGKEFYWHSDFETWHVEDGMPAMRALSCIVLLTDNDAHNGPLMVVPGSHATYVGCVGETPANNYQKSLASQTVGTPSREANSLLTKEAGGLQSITGKAGTVAFFDCNLLHGSAGNISPYARSNLFFVYNSVHNRLGAPLAGLDPRPEHIAHRLRTDTLQWAEVTSQ